jgi:hypothetical protein
MPMWNGLDLTGRPVDDMREQDTVPVSHFVSEMAALDNGVDGLALLAVERQTVGEWKLADLLSTLSLVRFHGGLEMVFEDSVKTVLKVLPGC